MKGYEISSYVKTLDELSERLQELPNPVPSKGEVLMQIECAGLNFFDVDLLQPCAPRGKRSLVIQVSTSSRQTCERLIRNQAYGKLRIHFRQQTQPAFPWVAGHECSGTIISVDQAGPDCPFKVGDRVFGATQGAFAELVACPWQALLLIPEGLTFEQAAGIHVTYPTGYVGLVHKANVQAGETVLVHAAAGGVGIAACQLAKALGAKVIATAGTPEKLQIAKEWGQADHVIDYTKEDWVQEVKKITNGKGADVVFDPVGMVEKSFKCLAWNGRILVVGFVAGTIEKVQTNRVLLKNGSLIGVFWGAHYYMDPETPPIVWKKLYTLFEQKKLKPLVFPKHFQGLESLAAGLKALTARGTYGRPIMRIRPAEAKSKL